ncbi:Protein of unknown function DUF159 [Pseudocohnilembus persalinus]|uniref:Uncharacterized protein n=1 Tax=Pseudocohnilembus persalinus TaxID=266149 RepID=A0A0V0Q7G7_PSEPJ|nr:Protein of unknown function DUF159 [Pseudocohnilembus persalinus]|eukprot:KRW98160.1 Protein of unknown function DUF159 [Pseudocohnilembus persalinus]
MCGRLWQTMNIQFLLRQANSKHVRNKQNYNGGTYNMGPTNYIPAIRTYNKFLNNVEEFDLDDEEDNDNELQQQIEEEQKQQILEQEQAKKNSINQKDDDELNSEAGDQFVQEINQDNFDPNLLQDDQDKLQNIEEGDRVVDFLKFGYQMQGGPLILNVKSEEASSKPTFKPLINKNRCVVMAQGYYEWDSNKNPHSFKYKNNETIYIAALYNNQDNVMLLTREAKGTLGKVHQRMPVVLKQDQIEEWLNCENSFADVTRKILSKWSWIEDISIQKLGPHVNNIREKGQKCLMSYDDYRKELDKKGIKRFFQAAPKKVDQNQNNDQKNNNQDNNQEDQDQKNNEKRLPQ